MAKKVTKGQPSKDGKLLSGFGEASYELWKEAAERSLKGKPLEKLVSKTYEGIDIQPIYMRPETKKDTIKSSFPGFYPYLRGKSPLGYKNRPWLICQDIPYPDVNDFNSELKYDLERGQTSVYLRLDYATAHGLDPDAAKADEVGHAGVAVTTKDDMKAALEGIDLKKYPIYFKTGSTPLPAFSILRAYTDEAGYGSGDIHGAILADIIGNFEQEGIISFNLSDGFDHIARLTAYVSEKMGEFKTINVDASVYHETGGSAVHELGFALSKGVEYIRELQNRGLDIDTIASHMIFTFSTGSNFFMEIAKYRAARMLWAKVVKEFSGSNSSAAMNIFASTGRRNKSKLDPYVNMLRSTNEALASVLGGCDVLQTLPFDSPYGLPGEFSRRTARNVQVILQEECSLENTVDPAGGSWYIESLTNELAEKAWDLFRKTEKAGGHLEAFTSGFINSEIDRIKEDRYFNFKTRKDVLVGTNKYPNLAEEEIQPVTYDVEEFINYRVKEVVKSKMMRDYLRLEGLFEEISSQGSSVNMEDIIEAAANNATIGELTTALLEKSEDTTCKYNLLPESFPSIFEFLRVNAQAKKVFDGEFPKVFLAAFGSLSEYKARVDFARDFFSVGGFEAAGTNDYENADQAVEDAVQSGSKIFVICSSDKKYVDLVPVLAPLIKKKSPEMKIILAGYPEDKIDQYRKAGVDEFIHRKANIYDILYGLQKYLGIF